MFGAPPKLVPHAGGRLHHQILEYGNPGESKRECDGKDINNDGDERPAQRNSMSYYQIYWPPNRIEHKDVGEVHSQRELGKKGEGRGVAQFRLCDRQCKDSYTKKNGAQEMMLVNRLA